MLSRWIQADNIVPLASQGLWAWDRYAYANNNPIRYKDPSGHKICEEGDCKTGRNVYAGIIFKGNWSQDRKRAVYDAAHNIGLAIKRVTADIREASEVFLDVFRNKSFTLISNNSGGCEGSGSGVVCDNKAVNDSRLYAHELGHTFNAIIRNNGFTNTPYSDVITANLLDDKDNWITGRHNGSFERTFRGYGSNRDPDVYHGVDFDDWNSPNEDFADMFMNWAFNSFDYSPEALRAGYKRYN